MKITAFYPAILTKNADKIIEHQSKFGFSVIHERDDLFCPGDKEYVLENENGKRMDVVYVEELEKNCFMVRVNVDDFDEALNIYLNDGFTIFKGPSIDDCSKNVLLNCPDGELIMLMQHIK